jgi:uncharacterized membrane protein
MIISIVPAVLIGKIATATGLYLGIPLQFLNVAWQSIIAMGLLKICLKLYDKQPVDFPDVWSCVPQTLDYVIVKILYGLIFTLGLILFIVPGLIWWAQFYTASFLVVDRGTKALDAFKTSSKITNGAKWDLGVFASVTLLVNLLGALLFGVGLLVSLPVTTLAGVFVYRKLLEQTEASGELRI